MSQSEIVFLALGLILGVAAGAAILAVVRGRLAPGGAVRLTISPNAIPARRPSTLASAGGVTGSRPVPGSPEDGAWTDDEAVPALPVPIPVAPMPIPVAPMPGTPATTQTAGIARTPVPSRPAGIPAGAVAIPIVRADVPASAPVVPRAVLANAVSASLARSAIAAAGRDERSTGSIARATAAPAPPGATAVAAAVAPARPTAAAPREPGGASASPGAASGARTGECGDERRVVDERAALAEVARAHARRAVDALRDARRGYDALRERVERAEELSDPRRVAETKSRLHAAFRARSERATGSDDTEAAAREWLDEINRLNGAVREAARLAAAGSADLRAQVPTLERLAVEADAARIGAENADGACTEARETLARCEERAHHAAREAYVPPPPEDPHPFAHIWPTDQPNLPRPVAPEPGPASDGLPVIVRVLRGDRDARERLVAALAGTDIDATREWQLRMAHLVDSIVARAIEDGYLDVPTDDPFWSLFGTREAREIVAALSSLGFRYDGLSGFADGRVPGARDLSMAVGYAGLDRMRIRAWPRESELASLYADVSVAAAEWLSNQAGDLSLGSMVDALGGRAGELVEVWNAWGRVRPVLLAP